MKNEKSADKNAQELLEEKQLKGFGYDFYFPEWYYDGTYTFKNNQERVDFTAGILNEYLPHFLEMMLSLREAMIRGAFKDYTSVVSIQKGED
jgi:hypothetical protein